MFGSRAALAVGIVAVLMGYVFYIPVPDGLADKISYIKYTELGKTIGIVAKLRSFFQPGDEIYFQTIRYLWDLTMPEGDAKVQGSNIEARYTEFDGVPVLLYEPIKKDTKNLAPAVIYYHGGGYAVCSTRMHGPMTRYMAENLGVVIVSVEYRLAPAHPFPTGVEDCLKATKWFLKHAAEFGVDASRVVVSGASAGSHISAVISQEVKDDSSIPDIKLQALFYPWLQLLDMNTPSYRNYTSMFGDTGGVSRSRMAEFTSALVLGRLDQHFMDQAKRNAITSEEFKQSAEYMRALDHRAVYKMLKTSRIKDELVESNSTLWEEIKDRMLDTRLNPLLRKDFQGLPKAYIGTADLDSLRDDGIFYARLLEDAGVTVRWKNYEGGFHGSLAPGPFVVPSGLKMIDDAVDFIREHV